MQNQNEMSIWDFHGNKVRIISINGEPWWLAKDVCDILGYSNGRDAITRHCKQGGVVIHDTPTNSGNQQMTYINEGNLYRLITSSKLPAAETFEEWVFNLVLPQIRKTGSYGKPDLSQITRKDLAVLLLQAEEELEKARLESQQKQLLIEEQKPKVEFYETCISSTGYYSMEQAAKIIGTGRNKLFDRLRSLNVIIHGRTTPYQKHVDSGYFVVKVTTHSNHIYSQTFVTPKGMDFLKKILTNYIQETITK